MNIDYKLIGSRIKAERTKLGYTQEALAEKLDVTVGYVSQVERGATKISLDLLGEISSILNCDVAALITESSVNSENYMQSEILRSYSKLTAHEKTLLIGFLDLLIENRHK